MLRFDNRVWLLWAVLILLLPLNWLMAGTAAAIIHELFHVVAVRMLGGRICSVTIAPFGAVIETDGIDGLREALCALAGPLGSFCLTLCIRFFPMLGVCALVQGCFNLLPVYPLDGGRAMLRILERFIPNQAEKICKCIERAVFFLLLSGAVMASYRYSLGFAPLFFCVFAASSALSRKRP